MQVHENERKDVEYSKARVMGDENEEKRGSSADS